MDMKVSKLKPTIILYGIIFIGFGIFQISRSFYHISGQSERDFSYEWKKDYFLFKNTYIEESCHIDSVYGPRFTSELCFYDQLFDQHNSGQIRVDLLNPKYKHIPKIYALYYIIISSLWGFAFYYLYRLALTFYKDNAFNARNPVYMKKLGKIILAIGFTKWFGMLLINLSLSHVLKTHVNPSYDYDVTLDWFFMIILGSVLQMFCNAFNKGLTLEQEQELTI
jgi:hypothetical protein